MPRSNVVDGLAWAPAASIGSVVLTAAVSGKGVLSVCRTGL
jgi:hypothetical protein